MNTRENLREVFVECNSRGIMNSLDDSYCFSNDTYMVKNAFRRSSKHIGYVYAKDKSIEQIMEDIDGEGSSTIYWYFEGRTKKIRNKVGYILAEVFQQMGYIVEWDESMQPKIAAVIEEEDLPTIFLENWRSTNKKVKDSVTPDSLVYLVDEGDEIESFRDTLKITPPCPNISTNDNLEDLSPSIDSEVDEGDLSPVTICASSASSASSVTVNDLELKIPSSVSVITKDEEKKIIFQSDEKKSDSEDGELSGLILEYISDEESEDEDSTVCLPNCYCVNCVAEREEAEREEAERESV